MDPAQAKREALLEALYASGSADAVKAAVFDLYNSGPPDKKDAVAFVSKVLRAPGAPPQHLRKSWPAPPRGREDFLRFLDQSGLPHTIMRGVRALAKEDDAVLADKDAVFDAIKVALEKGVPKPKRVRPPEGSRRRPPLQGSAPPKVRSAGRRTRAPWRTRPSVGGHSWPIRAHCADTLVATGPVAVRVP